MREQRYFKVHLTYNAGESYTEAGYWAETETEAKREFLAELSDDQFEAAVGEGLVGAEDTGLTR